MPEPSTARRSAPCQAQPAFLAGKPIKRRGRRLASTLIGSIAALAMTACSVAAVTFTADDSPGDDLPGSTTSTITISLDGAAHGAVSADGLELTCGTTCTATVTTGTAITLRATPDPGATFAGWSGGCTSSAATCQLTVSADVAVSARFDVAGFVVTVGRLGSGAGVVRWTPGGVTCDAACAMTVPYNTMVSLVAEPSASSTFAGWMGACTGGDATACGFTVTADTDVVAAFAAFNELLVGKSGNGSGTVTGNGIVCGGDCAETYAPGTEVTLSAEAAADSTFTGWSRPDCSGDTCKVTIAEATLVTASFALQQRVLHVAKAGNGTGTVTSVGIACGTDCDEAYDLHTPVTLTAMPAGNSILTGWSVAGCATDLMCTTTVESALTVTATFALRTFRLTVSVQGNGTGSVDSAPAGIDCGTACINDFNADSSVTLTPHPTGGSTFSSWGGACSGSGACQVTMTGAKQVTASFAPPTGLMVVSNFNATGLLVFAVGASGDTAPLRSISGPATTFDALRGVAVAGNEIIVVDQNAGAVDVFPVSANGDVAPIRRIAGGATGLATASGILVFGGEIYVGQQSGSIAVFPLAGQGNIAPTRTITGFGQSHYLAIANGEIYATDFSGRVVVFPATTSGAVVPTRIIAGAATGLDSPTGIFIHNGEIFVASLNNSHIRVFAQSANGDVAPLRVISGASTALSRPDQLAIFGGEIYAANFAGNIVTVYPVGANGNVAPTRTIAGPSTKLSNPLGIVVF